MTESSVTATTWQAWLRGYRPAPHARLRLVCFPHAGGGATFFRPWAGPLHPSVELLAVQYPGRQDRFHDPLVEDMDQLADLVTGALAALPRKPTALFGHSMGSAVAFEVALRMEAAGTSPEVLIVSGRAAPERPGTTHLDDDRLWNDVRQLGGTSDALLDEPGLRAAVMPALRGDYRVSETYRCRPEAVLRCPVLACIGDQDPETAGKDVSAWRDRTIGHFEVTVFRGGHFYLVPRLPELVDAVLRFASPRFGALPSRLATS
jgi:pyochelin biosynthetic protein PchC